MTGYQARTLAISLILTIAALFGTAEGTPRPERVGPWKSVIYDNKGHLIAASGEDSGALPLVLTSESEVQEGRLTTKISYQRGGRTLNIQRIFDGSAGVDTVYETKQERLVVSVLRDYLTGESLLVYRMPDGEVFSLWLAEDGDLLSGDHAGLTRSLQQPWEITRLLKAYMRHKEPFESELPTMGERMLMPLITCEDRCAVDCDRQCAFECAFGLPFCHICKVSCAIGCFIGCES